MSDNSTKIQSTSPQDYSKYAFPTRASYTPSNAAQFKAVFDKMMETQENQEILSSVSKLKPNTLYIKANDALKWLAECHPSEADRYSLLKSRVSIRKLDDRILIYFKTSMAHTISKATVAVKPGVSWKDELVEWLEKAQDGDMWEKDKISVLSEEKKWLMNLLAGLGDGVEADIKENSVRIMR